jgi:hypothetical protein
MRLAQSTVTGLLVGPAIAIGVLTGASQAAHAATPVKHASYAPSDHDHDHDRGHGWGRDRDHGWGRDHDHDRGHGWGRDRDHGWGH